MTNVQLPNDLFRPQVSEDFQDLPLVSYDDLFDYSIFPIIQSSNKPTEKVRLGYGREFPVTWSDLDIEMWCAARRLGEQQGGLGEFGHLKRCLQMLFPYLKEEWHHWLDMQVSMFCGMSGTHTMLGAGGTGKSWFLGTMARVWQACAPYKRLVMIINTTQETQGERAWKYVIKTGQLFPFLPGRLVGKKSPRLEMLVPTFDPFYNKMVMKASPGVGIISQTVKKGASAAATADIKGTLHADEVVVIIEETNHYTRTHLERARANWIQNRHCIVLMVGNPDIEDSIDDPTKDDALRFFSTPQHGWDSIEWGKNRWWYNRYGGKTFHIDAHDSPRVHDPERFKYSVWLPDAAYIEQKKQELGGEDTPLYKQQVRAIYDHDALPFTLITKTMVRRFEGDRPAKFIGLSRERFAAFDPAYSGKDEAFLKISESGVTESGKIEIDFLGEKTNFRFKLDTRSAIEPSFQMLNWVKEKLREWSVPYENFIMDANVIGIGLGDIFSTSLSKDITKVVVAGPATDRVLDLAGKQLAKDRCVNKQAEMWLAVQLLLISGQIRGLDDSIIAQLQEMPGEKENGKLRVLAKKEFRKRYGYSPDRAETILFTVDLLRDRGFRSTPGSASADVGTLGMTGNNSGNLSTLTAADIFDMRGGVPYGSAAEPTFDSRFLQSLPTLWRR